MNRIAKWITSRLDRKAKENVSNLEFSEFRPKGHERTKIRFFGTASFSIESDDHTLVFDPYVSRPSFTEHLDPLVPNKDLVVKCFPKANDIFVSHAHSDHILDAPLLCQLNEGSRMIGSQSVWRTGQAAGLGEQQLFLVEQDKQVIRSGPANVTAIESLHSVLPYNRFKLRLINLLRFLVRTPDRSRKPFDLLGLKGEDRGVLFPGETSADLVWPSYTWELRCGAVYDWIVEINGIKIAHISSARLKKNQLDGLKADIVCLCAMYRDKDFTKSVITKLQPSVIIPCHWDSFFSQPDSKGSMPEFKSAKIQEWLKELQNYVDEGILQEVHLLPFGGTFAI